MSKGDPTPGGHSFAPPRAAEGQEVDRFTHKNPVSFHELGKAIVYEVLKHYREDPERVRQIAERWRAKQDMYTVSLLWRSRPRWMF